MTMPSRLTRRIHIRNRHGKSADTVVSSDSIF